MSTTLIFAELVIIGLEVALWLCILALNVFGYKWLQNIKVVQVTDWQALVMMGLLSLIYVLGILFDRVADSLFLRWDIRLRDKLLSGYAVPIGVMRFEVCKHNKHLNQQFEYTRSRMRIARASSLNFGLITLLIVIFIFTRLEGVSSAERWGYTAFTFLVGGLLTVVAIYAWYKLMVGYLTFVKANYDFCESKRKRRIYHKRSRNICLIPFHARFGQRVKRSL